MDEHILYVRWTKEAVDKVNRGEASIAFLVNPISAQTVAEIAQQHELLPEKSTDFYPKMVSGLMMMDISASEKLQSTLSDFCFTETIISANLENRELNLKKGKERMGEEMEKNLTEIPNPPAVNTSNYSYEKIHR